MRFPALFLFTSLLAAQRLPVPVTGVAPLTATDSAANIITAYTFNTSGVRTTPNALQPQFAGGTCVFMGFHNSTEAPCTDLYIAKYAPDGTLLAATYLGGTGTELLAGVVVNPAGDIILTGTTTSKDLPGFPNPDAQNKGFVLRLSSSLDKVLAIRSLDTLFLPNLLFPLGDSLLVAGMQNGVGPLIYSVDAADLSTRWTYRPPGDPQTYVRAFARLTGGDLALVAGAQLAVSLPSSLYRLNPRDGSVVATARITGPSTTTPNPVEVASLAALPGDTLVVGGAYFSGEVDPWYNNRIGFLQRFDAALQPVETPQALGDFVRTLDTDAAGLIRIWGTATSGLATTADANIRCHGNALGGLTSTFYAELPYAQALPTLVTYVPDPASNSVLAGVVNGEPVLVTNTEVILAKRPTPAGPQPLCLDAKVQNYSVTLARAAILSTPNGFLKTETVPGELLTVFGSGLADQSFEFVPEELGGVPRQAGNTRFLVDGVPTGIIALSPHQASLAMPFALDGRDAVQLAVERDGQASAAIPLKVVSTAPSQLTVRQAFGERIGVYLRGAPCTADNQAAPGDEVSVYLLGGGAFDRPVDEAKVVEGELPHPANPVIAFVEGSGGQVVLYAGAVRGALPGLMQFNVRIAPDLKFRGRLTLSIIIGGRTSSSSFWLKDPPQ